MIIDERAVQILRPLSTIPAQRHGDDRLPLDVGARCGVGEAGRLRAGHGEHDLAGILPVDAVRLDGFDCALQVDIQAVRQVGRERSQALRRGPAHRPGLLRLRTVGADHDERVGPPAREPTILPPGDELFEGRRVADDEVRRAVVDGAPPERAARQAAADAAPPVENAHRESRGRCRPCARETRDPPTDDGHIRCHTPILPCADLTRRGTISATADGAGLLRPGTPRGRRPG